MLINNDQLTHEQLEQLDDLMHTVQQHDGSLPPVYKHLIMIQRKIPGNFLEYKSKQHLLAYLGLFLFYEKACEITLLIHPDARDKHLDFDLVKTALSLCKTKNLEGIIFATSANYHPPVLDFIEASLKHCEYRLIRNPKSAAPSPSTRLTFRLANPEDIPTLCQLDAHCFHTKHQDMPGRFALLLTDERYHILIAQIEDKLIGKLHLRFDEEEIELSDFCIFPAFQGQGLGGELLSHAIEHTSKHQSLPIALEVETDAEATLHLYQKQGFEIVNQMKFYEQSVAHCLSKLKS